MKTVDYILPAHWASALLYGDETGLDDDDSAALAAFLAGESDTIAGTCLDVQDDGDNFRTYHDAQPYGVLACDCATFTFPRVGVDDPLADVRDHIARNPDAFDPV